MNNLKQQFPYLDNEIFESINIKDKKTLKDKKIIKELKILNTEREKHLNAEKYKAESINKCLDLERQLSEAQFELNFLKDRLIKIQTEKEIKEKLSNVQ